MTRTTGYNLGLAKVAVQCLYDNLVQGSTVVSILNFCAKNPLLRQVANRKASPLPCSPLFHSLYHTQKKA